MVTPHQQVEEIACLHRKSVACVGKDKHMKGLTMLRDMKGLTMLRDMKGLTMWRDTKGLRDMNGLPIMTTSYVDPYMYTYSVHTSPHTSALTGAILELQHWRAWGGDDM